MAWTDLTFNFGAVLTSAQMTQLDDNFDALAADATGAPDVVGATRVLISSQTASGAASVDFTGIDGTYKMLELELIGVSPSVSTSWGLRIDAGGGFQATGYEFAHRYSRVTGADVAFGGASQVIAFVTTSAGPAAAAVFDGRLYFPDPANTTTSKRFSGVGTYRDSGGDTHAGYFGGAHAGSATAVTGIQVIAAAGTISGTFRLYGVKG